MVSGCDIELYARYIVLPHRGIMPLFPSLYILSHPLTDILGRCTSSNYSLTDRLILKIKAKGIV